MMSKNIDMSVVWVLSGYNEISTWEHFMCHKKASLGLGDGVVFIQ